MHGDLLITIFIVVGDYGSILTDALSEEFLKAKCFTAVRWIAAVPHRDIASIKRGGGSNPHAEGARIAAWHVAQ